MADKIKNSETCAKRKDTAPKQQRKGEKSKVHEQENKTKFQAMSTQNPK